jgi:hypothetical protein
MLRKSIFSYSPGSVLRREDMVEKIKGRNEERKTEDCQFISVGEEVAKPGTHITNGDKIFENFDKSSGSDAMMVLVP